MPTFAELITAIHDHPIETMAAVLAFVAIGKTIEGVKRRVAAKRQISSRPPPRDPTT